MPVSKNSSRTSRSFTGLPLMKYSLSPERYSRLRMETSGRSSGRISFWLEIRRVTSATFSGFRVSLPAKMMSCMFSARRDFEDCSPSTHFMASTTLLLPQPLGPSRAATPSENSIWTLSAKDLNPKISRVFKNTSAPSRKALLWPPYLTPKTGGGQGGTHSRHAPAGGGAGLRRRRGRTRPDRGPGDGRGRDSSPGFPVGDPRRLQGALSAPPSRRGGNDPTDGRRLVSGLGDARGDRRAEHPPGDPARHGQGRPRRSPCGPAGSWSTACSAPTRASRPTAIVKGDATVPEIMAASILAKTSRDAWMEGYARIEPAYGFEQHKGYPTAEHRALVLRIGPSRIHRRSFRVSSPCG